MDDSILMQIMVEAYPIIVFTKQLEDRSRKIMEIIEGEDYQTSSRSFSPRKKNLTINEYAELVGVSRICLNKSVKEQFGVTAKGMIQHRMLDEIKNLLLYSGHN